MRYLNHTAGFLITLILSGCSDPYLQALSPDGRVTPANAKELANSLPPEDKAVFERWVKRSISGERFAAEPIAQNIKHAISNQLEFEEKKRNEQEEMLAKERARKAEEDRLSAQKLAAENAAKILIDQRQKVASAIKDYFDVKLIRYELVDIVTPLGSKIGDRWKFSMRLKNLMADAEVVGFAGWLTVYDVFNQELVSVPFRLEPLVRRGSTIDYDAYMDFDPKSEGQVAMAATKSIRAVFFLESLALGGGRTIDKMTFQHAPAQSIEQKKNSNGT